MAIAAYQNVNTYPISISCLSSEMSITIPSLKFVAGNYDAYVGLIPGFIKAADDYLTLPSDSVVYVEVPWLATPIPLPFDNNAAALAAGLTDGEQYYTEVGGERIIKIVYTP